MRIFASTLLLLTIGASSAGAQTPLWLGTAFGYEYGVPLTIERTPGVVNRYDFEGRGTSYNHTFMLGGRAVLPNLFSPEWGLDGMLTLQLATGNFTSRLSSGLYVPVFGFPTIHRWFEHRLVGN